MRNVRIEATAALAAMLLFGLSASGAAQEEAGPIEETGRLAVAEAAVGVAEHLDVSVQEAIDQTWWQPALAELLAELDEDGVGYLGTRVDGTGARAYVVVAFSGEAPRRIVEHALADLGVIEIVEGVGIDRRELVRMMTDVHLAVEEAGLDVRVELDEIAGRLSITTGEPMDEQTLAAVRAIAGDRVADTLVGEVGPDELEGWVVGGGRVENISNSRVCTTGIPATRNGTPGLLSAGHCHNVFDAHHISNDPGTYASGDFGIFGLEFFDDSTGDWMWFYTTQTEKDRFVRNGLGTVQYVQGWGTIGSGWSVCQFGQATNPTGFLCNTARGVVSNADGAPVRELDNDNLNNGDSGGPVWYGSTAYGIHFGDPTGVAEAYTELATVRDTSSGNIQFNFE